MLCLKQSSKLIDDMLQILGKKKAKDWVAKRLVSLDAYMLERDGHKQKKQFEDRIAEAIQKDRSDERHLSCD